MKKKNIPIEFVFQLFALIIAVIVVHAFYVSVVRPNAAQIIEEQNRAAEADPDYIRERRVWVLIKDLEQEACFILMPADAPRSKREHTARLGGTIVDYDRYREDREAIARALAARRQAALVPSFDHPHVIAGQGTAGLEIVEQAEALGARLSQAVICCGGGGLSAGCAIAMSTCTKTPTRVWLSISWPTQRCGAPVSAVRRKLCWYIGRRPRACCRRLSMR